VGNEREKDGKGGRPPAAGDEDEERPTVAPPFDPIEFAKSILGNRPSPAGGTSAPSDAPSVASSLSDARSDPSAPPAGPEAVTAPPGRPEPSSPPLGRAATSGRSRPALPKPTPPSRHGPDRTPEEIRRRDAIPTLTDEGELEAARKRSASRTRPTPEGILSLANARVPSQAPPRKESIGAFGAVDREWVELATRPPPPGFNENVAQERGTASAARDAAASDDDAPTRPPPPMQQDLIDALARGDSPPSTRQGNDLVRKAGAAAVGSLPPNPPAAIALPSVPPPPTIQEMNDRVSLGDYTGALEVAERLLAIDPDDLVAKTCAATCRGVLRKMYSARIGPLDRVPMVMVARDQLRWLSIDHRAGFVLSLIDGVSSLEMILDVTGMPELDALRILSELVQQRIISFR